MAFLRCRTPLAVAACWCTVRVASITFAQPSNIIASPVKFEQDLYAKHWWPLVPPPFHHPLSMPSREELKANQALEANYTHYWQGLPRYSGTSPRLEAAQRAPYFKAAWRTKEGPPMLLRMWPVFVVHHKTGENLHTNVKRALGGKVTFQDIFEPFPAGCPREGPKVVHLVRRPVDMIVSGYRYHQNKWGSEIWSWGHMKFWQDPQCFECDNEDHAVMFETCAFNCTYFEMLNRVDENTGSAIEAISARKSITSMANYLARCRNMPNILHISFDLLRTDYKQSAACMLKFLGLKAEDQLDERLAAAMQEVTDPDHTTSGLFHNRALKERLRENPAWGPDFAAVDALMDEAFRYQAQAYGCPEREFDDS